MSISQIVFTLLLLAVLGGLAVYYAGRQLQTLRGLRGEENLPPEDRQYVRNQAWRRLACSAMMLLFAGLLAGSFTMEFRAQELVDAGEAAHARNERPDLDPDQRQFFRGYILYWGSALLVLLAMIVTAFFDILAIRRYGRRHFDKIKADRRAMIERQAAKLRGQRNGHS